MKSTTECRSSGVRWLLSISDTSVFVSEGFPLELARKLRDLVMSVQSDAPLQVAGAAEKMGPEHDPGLSLARVLSSAGMMKAMLKPLKGVPDVEAKASPGRYTLTER